MAFSTQMKRLAAKNVRASTRRASVVVRATSRVNQKKTDIIVSPSILSADFARLGEEIKVSE